VASPLPDELAGALAAGGVLVLGLGLEGLGTYRYLRAADPLAPIALADARPLEALDPSVAGAVESDPRATFLTGPSYLERADRFAVVFKSPGIPPDLPELERARRAGARITSHADLFLSLAGPRTIGVTGTKGKSTTASVIHAVLAGGGLDARLVGNIGVPALSALEGSGPATWFVMELSSFQLDSVGTSPRVAVVQNVLSEHLDWHRTLDRYVGAKSNVVRFQGPDDVVVFNRDHPVPRELAGISPGRRLSFGFSAPDGPGAGVQDDWLVHLADSGHAEPVLAVEEVPLLGRFNLLNVMPGLVLGRLLGVPAETVAGAIRGFRPLEHRLEPVGEVDGVRFVNDSLATLPEAAAGALEAMAGAPVVLIAGGYDRGQDFRGLARRVVEAGVRALVLFPPTGDRLWEEVVALSPPALPAMARVQTMPEAVDRALEAAEPGDVVLLSPASASFGRFRDYRDRGERFRDAVRDRAERARGEGEGDRGQARGGPPDGEMSALPGRL
jgi:UDP-N-acetylmuramoylalanine--D-glutamate ligase